MITAIAAFFGGLFGGSIGVTLYFTRNREDQHTETGKEG